MREPTIFLDRDGTLIEIRHYLSSPADVALERGVGRALLRLARAGFRLVVVTNQSGIARGYFGPADLAAVTARLKALLEAEGIIIQGWYHCPHMQGDGCACRKPEPGLLDEANSDHPVDWEKSYLVGDSLSDARAAIARGVSPIMLASGHGARLGEVAAAMGIPWLDDMMSAADFILSQIPKIPGH